MAERTNIDPHDKMLARHIGLYRQQAF